MQVKADEQSVVSLQRHLQMVEQLPLLFSAGGSIEQIWELVLKHIRSALNAEAAALFLLDDSGSSLSMWCLHGEAEGIKHATAPSDRGIVGWVVKHRRAVIVNDPGADSRFADEVKQSIPPTIRNLVCLPLGGSNPERLGALQVFNTQDGGFSDDDREVLERAAPHLVLGMQKVLLAQRLEETEARLTALRKKREDMLSVLTHELRTPVGLIQGSAELLATGNIPLGLARRTTEKLNEGVDRLLRVVAGLRNGSMTRAGGSVVSKASFSVSEVIGSIVATLSNATQSVRSLSFQEDVSKSLTALGDDALFSVAISNLLHNAIRFTPDGGSVRIRAFEKLGTIIIEIADSGVGIAPSEVHAIFERFYKVGDVLAHSSGSLQFQSGGLGLGLATAKSILDAHGASIEVESELGSGSLFRVRVRSTQHVPQ